MFVSIRHKTSSLFFLAACFISGGLVGLTIRMAIGSNDLKHAHVPDLGPFIYGLPIGALVGLLIGLVMHKRFSVNQLLAIGGLLLMLGLAFGYVTFKQLRS